MAGVFKAMDAVTPKTLATLQSRASFFGELAYYHSAGHYLRGAKVPSII